MPHVHAPIAMSRGTKVRSCRELFTGKGTCISAYTHTQTHTRRHARKLKRTHTNAYKHSSFTQLDHKCSGAAQAAPDEVNILIICKINRAFVIPDLPEKVYFVAFPK